MPVADFFGRWNWGYDGVLLFAPDSAYGRPEDLQGADRRRPPARPDGVPRRGLQPLRPGGELSRPLRAAVLQQGRHALGQRHRLRESGGARASRSRTRCTGSSDYRFDGLRLDAVHAIAEPGRKLLLERAEPGRRRARAAQPAGTSIWCWRTTPTRRACSIPRPIRRAGKYRAQWNDDYHHAFHVLLTGEARAITAITASRRGICAARSPRASPIRASRRRIARAARAARSTAELARHGLRQFPAEPRPDRQPRVGRAA